MDDMTENPVPQTLFLEKGGNWLWLLAGPASGVAMLLIQLQGGVGIRLAVPILFFVLVTGFVALQIKAARVHTSVELTTELLREGTEVIPVSEIVKVYPELTRANKAESETKKWVDSRSLGELSGVPRGRRAIGIGLTGGRTARAWARKHRELRAALVQLVDGKVNLDKGEVHREA
jgi:hypothetical protein